MRAGQGRIDRVAERHTALAAVDQEVERRRNERGDRDRDEPQCQPAGPSFLPVEVACQPGGEAHREGDDAVRCRDRIDRVGTDEVADEADTAPDPWAGDDAGEYRPNRIEKERQAQRDGDRMPGEVQAEAGEDEYDADRVEAESERTGPTGRLQRSQDSPRGGSRQ